MVLEFTNKVTLIGGSDKLREDCLYEIFHYSLLYNIIISEDDSSELIVTTQYHPLDNCILDLAAKYLALDFVIEFKPAESSTLLKDWDGCIRVVDQILYFSDNYEALDGYELGSIYQLKAKGGFPECLRDFHS